MNAGAGLVVLANGRTNAGAGGGGGIGLGGVGLFSAPSSSAFSVMPAWYFQLPAMDTGFKPLALMRICVVLPPKPPDQP